MVEKNYKLYGTKILNLKTQEIGLLICLWENKYADYVALGSEKACRDVGKIGIEGKEYVVEDGDIMHFLFNV